MSKTLFISEETAKESTIIHENIDNKFIRDAILDVQELKIKPLLGSTLFNTISDQIDADTVTALHITLLDDYILPAIRGYLKSELPMRLNFKFTNKSVNSNSGDNSEPVDLDTLFRISKHYENKAEELAERATNFLKENRSDYPEFDQPDTGLDVIRPNKSNYTTGMWLGDSTPEDNDIECGCT